MIHAKNLRILCRNDKHFRKYKFSANKFEKKAEITDFAVLLGGYIKNCGYDTENRNGYYWTSTNYYKPSNADVYDEYGVYIGYADNENYSTYTIDPLGKEKMWMSNATSVGIRPALKVDLESDAISNLIYCHNKQVEMRIGNYPQNAVSRALQIILEDAFNRGNINLTGMSYTVPLVTNHNDSLFVPYTCYEFEYNNKKYVRVRANFYSQYFEKYYQNGKFYRTEVLYKSNTTKLANGEEYSSGDYVWVEVNPVEWIANKKDSLLISKKIIVAGVANNYNNTFSSEHDVNGIFDYMGKYLENDLFNHQLYNNNECENEHKKKVLHR